MKIIRRRIKIESLTDFADEHGLTMVVTERSRPSHSVERFYANFEHAETKDDNVLCGTHGNGNTEAEAIADYASQISLKKLVINAMSDNRREIDCPRLTV